MQRSLTVRERLHVQINRAASEALRAPIPEFVRGTSRHPCPRHDGCGKTHTHHHTNHRYSQIELLDPCTKVL